MDNEPVCAILCFIYLDKMVAAAQCAHRTKSLIFLDMTQTKQVIQVCLCCEMMRRGAHLFSGWNFIVNQFIQLLQLQTLCMKLDSQHSAANIHAHQTGSHTVLDGHCGADSTAFSGVNSIIRMLLPFEIGLPHSARIKPSAPESKVSAYTSAEL